MCTICSSFRPYSDTCDYRGLNAAPPETASASTAAAAPTGSLDALADYLVSGYWQDHGVVAHAFNTAIDTTLSVNLTGLTAAGQQLARWALEAWQAVADLQFTETAGAADITFQDDQPGAFTSYTVFGTSMSAATVNVSSAWLASYGDKLGAYGFQVYMHEIGHALGLGHQGNYDGAASYGSDETFANDSWQLSVMSYFNQTVNTSVTASKAEAVTTMAADVLAIQSVYGAAGAGSLTAGDTTYGLGHSLGSSWLGQLFDAIYSATPTAGGIYDGGPVAATLWDAGGYDIVDFSDDSGTQVVDLAPEGVSNVYGQTGNLVIARGTLIEEFRAGAGNDTLRGNDADNLLLGGPGDDVLRGGNGDDILNGGSLDPSRSDGADAFHGGAGIDTVSYAGSRGSLRVDMVYSSINTFSARGDTFDSIENLIGSQGADNLRGTTGANRIEGAENVDYIFGRKGDDTLVGGIGDDVLFGGLGADTLIGGAHTDRAQYSESLTALTLDLLDPTRNSGEATGDSYAGIEDLAGSEFGDEIFGDNGGNRLFGRGGDDRLTGRAGDDYLNGGGGQDVLLGGAGDDVLRGGASRDTFVFDGGADLIEDYFLDALRFDDALWGGTALSGAQVLSTYASLVAGDTVFDFGAGDTLTLQGHTDIAGLDGYISIF